MGGKMNITQEWADEWQDAYNFFNSKGNVKTRSRLKDKWYKNFKNRLERLENEVYREL